MDLAQALVAISAAVVGAGIALIGSVYAARANRAAMSEGLALERLAMEESWQREQEAAHRRWVRDQIDLRVGEVLVAVNRFSRAAEAGSFDGAWVEFANANDRLARVMAGDDVDVKRRELWDSMFLLFQWRCDHRDLDGESGLHGTWWDGFAPIWEKMGALNNAARFAVDKASPR